jgi:hypothetical protein
MPNVANRNPNVITAAGAVPPGAGLNHIAATGAVALTVAQSTVDGQEMTFLDEGGHAHTVVCTGAGSPPTAGLNGGTTANTLTFGATKGSSVTIIARNGFWWSTALNGVTVS